MTTRTLVRELVIKIRSRSLPSVAEQQKLETEVYNIITEWSANNGRK